MMFDDDVQESRWPKRWPLTCADATALELRARALCGPAARGASKSSKAGTQAKSSKEAGAQTRSGGGGASSSIGSSIARRFPSIAWRRP